MFEPMKSLVLLSIIAAAGLCGGLRADSAPPPFSYYPRLNQPDHLRVIERDALGNDEYLMVVTLQGILAQTQPRIFIRRSGADHYWLNEMVTRHGVTTETSTNGLALLAMFKDEVAGYILADPVTPSVNSATSMAGIRNAIVVTPALEPAVAALGLPRIMDVRAVDPRSIFDDYKHEFNNSLIFTADNHITEMRDLIVACRGFIYHESDAVPGRFFDENAVYGWVRGDSPQIGWGGVSKPHEDDFVGDASRKGLFTIPANWTNNLSVMLGFRQDALVQQPAGEGFDPNEDAHYLAIMMSDGDNFSFVLQGMADDPKYFASPHRGNFPMNWTMPSTAIDMAPLALRWYYENAGKDYFVGGGSGAGYMFPSNFPDLALHMKRFNDYAGRSGLDYVGMLDLPRMSDRAFHRAASLFAKQPNIGGVVSVNFYDYAMDAGRLVFVGDTPFLAMRENLWDLNESQRIALAQKINGYPRDPSNPASYTIMNVHAWSQDMSDVASLVSHLAPHVKVVTVKTLFERLKQKVEPGSYRLADLNFAMYYDDQSGVQVEGDYVAFIENGNYIGYQDFDFGQPGSKTLVVRAASPTAGGRIEVRLDSPQGELIGTVDVGHTGGWDNWWEFSGGIDVISGRRDVYFKFVGGGGFLFNLDTFNFVNKPVVTPDVRTAIGLRFPTEPGKRYLVGSSPDLLDWWLADALIEGDGQDLEVFFPIRDRGFFRVLRD